MHTTQISLDGSPTPVQNVTIHQSTAEVTRTITSDLQVGVNIVEIRGLSSQIDTDSLRLVSDAASVRVLESTCRLVSAGPFGGPSGKHADALRTLASRRSMLESERAVRQKEVEILDEGARGVVHRQAADMDAFMDTFVQRKRAAQKAVLELAEQIREIEHEASALSNASKGETNAVATVTVFSERECSVELQLTYVVTGVAWSPYYDFHARTAEGRTSPDVSLLYCATVTQATGEDWSNATLVLSTASAQSLRNLSVPSLESVKVSGVPMMFGERQSGATSVFDASFGQGPTAAPRPSGSLFGQAAAASNVPFASAPQGGLFGARPAAANTAPPSTGTSAFGQPASSQSAFGQPASSQPAFGQSVYGQPATGTSTNTGSFGLFGSNASTASTRPAQGGSFHHPLFGSSSAAPPQPLPFGSTTSAQLHQGPFGASNNPSSAFGAASASSTSSPFAAGANNNPSFQDVLQSLERYGSSGPNPGFGAFGSTTNPSTATNAQPSGFGQTTQNTAPGAFGSTATSAPTTTTQVPAGEPDNNAIADDAAAHFANMSVIDRSPVAAAYRLKDKVSIPSDGLAHKVAIARLDFVAEIEYVSVPRKSSGVFVQARVKNTSEYELLAGPANVFMDNSLVAKVGLPIVAPDEKFECVLGIDTALKVTYHSVIRSVNDPTHTFAAQTKTVTRTLTTTIKNAHQFDITNLVVRDAIPLGNRFSNLFVTLRKPAGLAHAKDGEEVVVPVEAGSGANVKTRWSKVVNGQGGEKAGLYEWAINLSAGKTVSLVAEWDIKAPTSVLLNEIPQHGIFGRS